MERVYEMSLRNEISETCSETEPFMLTRQDIQNDDSLTIKGLHPVLRLGLINLV